MEKKVTFSSHSSQVKEKSGIVEFQAFRGNDNKFIVKELVILDLQTCVIYTFLFKPPFPFNKLNSKSKRTNKWLTKNLHHIAWNDGYTDFKELESIMYHFCSRFTKLYTRGQEKRNWIQLYTTKDVIDVKVNQCLEIDSVCILTKDEKHAYLHCAVKNAYRLAAFLQQSTMNSKVEGEVEGEVEGGVGGYKSGESEETYHQYYSRLERGNTYQDGITEIFGNIS